MLPRNRAAICSLVSATSGRAFAATYTFLAINGARIAADAKAAYVFIAGLYETNDFTFEKLAAWLRDNVEPTSP
jgi:death on curing protein